MSKSFRVQVVGLYQGDLRTILWVKQNDGALRAGLTVPDSDLHVTRYEGEGTHDRARGDPDIPIIVMHSPQNTAGIGTVAAFMPSDVATHFTKFKPFKQGQADSVVLLDLESMPLSFSIAVHEASKRFFLCQVLRTNTLLVHLEISREPRVALCVNAPPQIQWKGRPV